MRFSSIYSLYLQPVTRFSLDILAFKPGQTGSGQRFRDQYFIIQKKENVLVVPERVVTFRNDSAIVKLALAAGKEEQRVIKTGLSDAINIEVLDGLKEGDEVFEKPVKKID